MKPSDTPGEMSAVKRALIEIRDLKARLARSEAKVSEPIAVIGMGCRFPGGADDPEALWKLLESGVDAIGPVPPDRWDRQQLFDADPDRPGKMVTTEGGFLTAVDQFDAEFFGIAPLEAETMDPQQRLLLEVAWEALERAGIAPDSLRGSSTGVFIGMGNSDYGRMLLADRSGLDAYAGSGGSYAVAAGRISYLLGLQGPALAIDTACSASLVAIHVACQSLRNGEIDLALVGGVNLILGPEAHIAFSKARMMAPDGRCKTFDASADGYGRGEGCGVVVLRRLSDAVASGDRVQATIRGSAVNQDGRSSGLTVPNGPAQVAVIRSALSAAGLEPADVDLVEAHGTGTPLGDPIELGALATAYGTGRAPDRRLLVGSLKTNLGHLEAAAGIAGFMKAVMAVERGVVPPHLHFREPTRHLDWTSALIRVPTRVEPWPEIGDRPRRAGVSSFGFSGTNAHLVVEQGAVRAPVEASPRWVLMGSGRTEAALSRTAASLKTAVERASDGGAALAVASGSARAHQAHRFAIPMLDQPGLVETLSRIASGERPGVARFGSVLAGQSPRIAFLFTGQGSQYLGMGSELYRDSVPFRKAVDRVVAIAGEKTGRDILGVITGTSDVDVVAMGVSQPTLFAFQYALCELWRSWGIEPAVVVGHSFGEYAAAVSAGLLDVETATRLVVTRGRLMQALPEGGSMIAVEATDADVAAEIAADSGIDIAAINAKRHVVLSGTDAAIAAVIERFTARGISCRRLLVSHAAHSRLMEPMLEPFAREIGEVAPTPGRVRLISTATGSDAGPDFGTAGYWTRQIRLPVRFAAAFERIRDLGIRHVVEIGPHPVLSGMIAADSDDTMIAIPSLRRGAPAWTTLLDGLAALHVEGAPVRWAVVQPGRAAVPELPTSAFDRRRHWIKPVSTAAVRPVTAEAKWAASAAAARRQAEQVPLSFRVDRLNEGWEALARLTWAHASETLRRLDAFDPGAPAGATVDEVMTRTGIKPVYRHLVSRWLDRLSGGVLERRGDRFRPAAGALPRIELAPLWQSVDALFPSDHAMLTYLRGCGEKLESVLTGSVSPLETLFPGGSPALAESLYSETGVMRYANLIAAAAIEALATRTGGRPFRLLEVGAGTGGTTVAIMPRLDAEQVEYWFTDVSDVFLSRAAERFGTSGQLRFAMLDLDREPAEQGYAAGSFDAIVATNAVHATKDLRSSLRRLHDLLAPGGTLVLVESTRHLDWYDMSTGLIEGWQHFEDDLRGDNPLLTADRWRGALAQAGFSPVEVVPEDASPAAAGEQRVVLAQKPGDAIGDRVESVAAAGLVISPASPSAQAEQVMESLRDAPETLREEILVGFVRDRVMQILRLAANEEPARQQRLLDLGFDSLMAVQLRNKLGSGLGLEAQLPATLLFDHPTIEAIARFLQTRLGFGRAAAAPRVESPRSDQVISESELAEMTEEQVAEFLLQRLGDG